eukprot:TRINITY_DN14638_c0_g1_i1.p1 TRINITY_DN14638_c0_g1~~TRINITY_DN14638_c0_g1_i1.p1  ORF type:complete len:1190 (+),score=140.78 TRINITY_DN14638_c0_g1_i1:76-3645(+)
MLVQLVALLLLPLAVFGGGGYNIGLLHTNWIDAGIKISLGDNLWANGGSGEQLSSSGTPTHLFYAWVWKKENQPDQIYGQQVVAFPNTKLVPQNVIEISEGSNVTVCSLLPTNEVIVLWDNQTDILFTTIDITTGKKTRPIVSLPSDGSNNISPKCSSWGHVTGIVVLYTSCSSNWDCNVHATQLVFNQQDVVRSGSILIKEDGVGIGVEAAPDETFVAVASFVNSHSVRRSLIVRVRPTAMWSSPQSIPSQTVESDGHLISLRYGGSVVMVANETTFEYFQINDFSKRTTSTFCTTCEIVSLYQSMDYYREDYFVSVSEGKLIFHTQFKMKQAITQGVTKTSKPFFTRMADSRLVVSWSSGSQFYAKRLEKYILQMPDYSILQVLHVSVSSRPSSPVVTVGTDALVILWIDGADIMYQFFNAQGSVARRGGNTVFISGGAYLRLVVSLLQDFVNFIVCYEQVMNGVTHNYIELLMVNPDQTHKLGSILLGNPDSSQENTVVANHPDSTCYSNIFVWEESIGSDYSRKRVAFRLFRSDYKLCDIQIVDSSSDDVVNSTDPQVSILHESFIIAWQETYLNASVGTVFREYSSNGRPSPVSSIQVIPYCSGIPRMASVDTLSITFYCDGYSITIYNSTRSSLLPSVLPLVDTSSSAVVQTSSGPYTAFTYSTGWNNSVRISSENKMLVLLEGAYQFSMSQLASVGWVGVWVDQDYHNVDMYIYNNGANYLPNNQPRDDGWKPVISVDCFFCRNNDSEAPTAVPVTPHPSMAGYGTEIPVTEEPVPPTSTPTPAPTSVPMPTPTTTTSSSLSASITLTLSLSASDSLNSDNGIIAHQTDRSAMSYILISVSVVSGLCVCIIFAGIFLRKNTSKATSNTANSTISTQLLTIDTDGSRSISMTKISSSDGDSVSLLSECQKQFEWTAVRPLGTGTFGTVVLGMRASDGYLMAVKVIAAQNTNKSLIKEVSRMTRLSHVNVIKYLGVTYDERDGKASIFMEYVEGGTLHELAKASTLPETVAWKLIKQVVQGLSYIHGEGVIHRDIKGNNILIGTNRVVLADFGCSRDDSQQSAVTFAGTPSFMPPEIVIPKGNPVFTSAVDIWSLGCTVCEVFNSGEPPWPFHASPWTTMLHIASVYRAGGLPSKIPSHLSKDSSSFVMSCFDYDPKTRPSADDLLDHPFLQQDASSEIVEVAE